MPVTRSSSDTSFTLRIPRNSVRIAGIAFCGGVLLFVAVWLANRDKGFYQAGPAAPQQKVAEVEPLPEPLAAAAGASELPQAPAAPRAADDSPALDDAEPPPSLVDSAPPAGEMPAPAPSTPQRAQPVPIPAQSPPPRYPPAALRRGEGGSVLLRVDVDAAGSPTAVTLLRPSGSRELDRAASQVVRRWRFTPAMRDGQPVAGSVEVPFDFAPDR